MLLSVLASLALKRFVGFAYCLVSFVQEELAEVLGAEDKLIISLNDVINHARTERLFGRLALKYLLFNCPRGYKSVNET